MPHARALARLAGRAVAVAVGEAWRGGDRDRDKVTPSSGRDTQFSILGTPV
jgi:hypothetical protein